MANPTKVCSVVRSILAHGKGIYTVDFDVPVRATKFRPGQFLHLTLDEFDPTSGYWPESRVFSIACEPKQDYVTVVYSVKGVYTKRMETELAIGRKVWLKLPYGDFVIGEDMRRHAPLVLIAGGTGVSPYWPFLKQLSGEGHPVHLFYGVREPEHILFHEDLLDLSVNPAVRVHLFLESGSVSTLPYQHGRLSVDSILRVVGDEANLANYYLSGPPGMIKGFQAELIMKNKAEANIHIDEWE